MTLPMTRTRSHAPCAYCGSAALTTREHVLPHWLIKLTREGTVDGWGYDSRANMVSANAPVVRDVCAACNNVHLGRLDHFAKQAFAALIDRANSAPAEQFELHAGAADETVRWIAKVLVNKDRLVGATDRTSSLAQYVLHGDGPRPFSVYAQLLRPGTAPFLTVRVGGGMANNPVAGRAELPFEHLVLGQLVFVVDQRRSVDLSFQLHQLGFVSMPRAGEQRTLRLGRLDSEYAAKGFADQAQHARWPRKMRRAQRQATMVRDAL